MCLVLLPKLCDCDLWGADIATIKVTEDVEIEYMGILSFSQAIGLPETCSERICRLT